MRADPVRNLRLRTTDGKWGGEAASWACQCAAQIQRNAFAECCKAQAGMQQRCLLCPLSPLPQLAPFFCCPQPRRSIE